MEPTLTKIKLMVINVHCPLHVCSDSLYRTALYCKKFVMSCPSLAMNIFYDKLCSFTTEYIGIYLRDD